MGQRHPDGDLERPVGPDEAERDERQAPRSDGVRRPEGRAIGRRQDVLRGAGDGVRRRADMDQRAGREVPGRRRQGAAQRDAVRSVQPEELLEGGGGLRPGCGEQRELVPGDLPPPAPPDDPDDGAVV